MHCSLFWGAKISTYEVCALDKELLKNGNLMLWAEKILIFQTFGFQNYFLLLIIKKSFRSFCKKF